MLNFIVGPTPVEKTSWEHPTSKDGVDVVQLVSLIGGVPILPLILWGRHPGDLNSSF